MFGINNGATNFMRDLLPDFGLVFVENVIVFSTANTLMTCGNLT